MITPDQLKIYIGQFVALQILLLTSFKAKFAESKDWVNLLDFPKGGVVEMSGEQWRFNLHGCGLRFESQEGVIVDAHDYLSEFGLIDAWRILQYLDSISAVKEDDLTFSQLNEGLRELADKGELQQFHDLKGKYVLNRPGFRGGCLV